MIRIAVVADSHFDESSRFQECCRLHDWIVSDARDQGCRAWLHAGDVYERKSTPRERLAVAEWVQDMAMIGPGVIVRGNHDALDDLAILQRLDIGDKWLQVVDGARVVHLPKPGSAPKLVVGCLSWPRRSHVHSVIRGDASKELVELVSADALRAVLRGIGGEFDAYHGVPRILLAHAMVRGSITSTGQPLVGCDFELGLEDLALARAHLYALGHIHKGQAWAIESAPVVYPGSPRRTAFGELEAKGYTIAEWDGSGFRCEFREGPATPMVHLAAVWEGPDVAFCRNIPTYDFEKGAEIRLRYETASDQREAARGAAEKVREVLLERGALHVKIEEVVRAEQRSRAPGIVAAATLTEKLEQLWTVKGFDPGERRDALLGKANSIEEPSNAA